MQNTKRQDDNEEYLLPKEVAGRLRISIGTVSRMIRDAEIVAIEVRGNWRIPKAEFEEYLIRRRNVPTAPANKVAA